MYAANRDHRDTVTILLQQGADANIKSDVSYIISICYNYNNYVMIVWMDSSHVSCL